MSTPQYRPPEPTRSPARRSATASGLRRPWVGWVLAPLPILSVGLLTFVPFLRSGLIRPAQRWLLIGLGIVLEAVGVGALMLIGSAPEDAEGHVTGWAGDGGTAVWLLTMAVATALAVVFRDPVRVDLNRLPAVVLAKRARIPLRDAEQIVAQRHLLGSFSSVEQAIDAADLPEESVVRLWDVGAV